MNLLDRLKMVGAVICLLSFVACEDPTELGKNLQNIKNIEVRYAEIPLEMGMIRVDSINTTNRGFLMVGEVNDPVFGKITASSFTHLSYRPASKISVDQVYDSIVLLLYLKEFSSLSEDTELAFEIKELSESLNTVDNYSSNSDAIPTYAEVVGSFSKTILKDRTADTVRITLDKSWGQKFFNFLRDKNNSVVSDSTYRQSFFNDSISHGLAILPISTDGITSINVGINTSRVQVYYHKDTISSFSNIDLNFPDVNNEFIKGFTKIEVDRGGSVLSYASALAPLEFFSSSNSIIYNSNLTGIYPAVSLGNLFSFFDTLENVVINRTDIIIKEVENPETLRTQRPSNFLMYASEDPISLDPDKTIQGTGLNVNPIGKDAPTFISYRDKKIYSAEITNPSQAVFDKTISFDHIVFSNIHRLQNDTFFYPFNNLTRLEIESVKLKIYYTVPINK